MRKGVRIQGSDVWFAGLLVRMPGYAILLKPIEERTTSGGPNRFEELEKRVREFVSIFEPS